MTYEELEKVNNAIKTTVIEKKNKKTGEVSKKDYAEVNQKIKAFRKIYPEGTISTELLSNENGVAIFKASVFDDKGKLLGTGTAYEKEGSTFINETSYIENCETSACGRALAMCGIGIDLGVASYEEVANAKLNQKEKAPSREEMLKVAKKHYPEGSEEYKKLLSANGFEADTIDKLTDAQLMAIYSKYGGK